MIQSSRHKILGLQQRLDRVIARAASSIANFQIEDADKDALSVLLSESVIIAEGRLIGSIQPGIQQPALEELC